MRILASDCGVADYSDATFQELLSKHPSPSRIPNFPDPPDSSIQPLIVSENDVLRCIRTFPTGSAAGIDGLRPQHLKDLTSTSAGESGKRLLRSVTNLCNFLLKGDLHPAICPYLYGASLLAINKKDGGIRPIAIGNVFRRLVAKLSCFSVRNEISEYLYPHQLGFGSKLGCEKIIHTVRSFVNLNANSNKILLKIDLRNAFNSIDRDVMLQVIKDKVPRLFAFIWQCYRHPTNLFYGSQKIPSQTGCQQGDPLGPLLFSLGIHSIVQDLVCELNLFYLDDGTLGGDPEIVFNAFQKLVHLFSLIGLEINTSKCELFFCSDHINETAISSFLDFSPDIKIISKSELNILGSPIFSEAVLPAAQQKLLSLKTLLDRLVPLNAHVSYFLIKNCLLIPKMTFFMRTTPLWLFPTFLEQADEMICNSLELIINIPLSNDSRLQASLPIKCGGLGIRNFKDICLPTYLASSFGVSDFIQYYFSSYEDDVEICFLKEALDRWSSLTQNHPHPDQPQIQRSWDKILTKQQMDSLFNCYTSSVDHARFLALQTPEAGSWLHAIPSSTIGTLLENQSFKIAIALRLGCKICHTHQCICGGTVDSFGHHALSCSKSKGRIPRHAELNDIIKRALISSGFPAILEPCGISRSDGKRPDGMTLIPWNRGKSLLWDSTCVDTLAPSHLSLTSKIAGSAAESAVRIKRQKYHHLLSTHEFYAFAVETFGSWSTEARELVSVIGKYLISSSGDPRCVGYLHQRIGLAIQRGNSTSILGSFPDSDLLSEIFIL